MTSEYNFSLNYLVGLSNTRSLGRVTELWGTPAELARMGVKSSGRTRPERRHAVAK